MKDHILEEFSSLETLAEEGRHDGKYMVKADMDSLVGLNLTILHFRSWFSLHADPLGFYLASI